MSYFCMDLRTTPRVWALRRFGLECINKRCISSETKLLSVTENDGVRRIVMKDKATRNSMCLAMTKNLLKFVTYKIDDPKLRCIIISSSGPGFSGGHNLKELANSEGREVFYIFGELMMSIINCPVPVITVIDGAAAAAGCQLVAQSDIAICSPQSVFSTPGANFGIFCSTPGIALSRSTHRKLTTYMLFTCNPITAQEALQGGLVSRVAAEGNLDGEVNCAIDAIKAKSRAVLQQGKQFFYSQLDMSLSKAYRKGAQVMDYSLTTPDGIEGLRSFAEKRKPVWKHRNRN